MNIRTYQKEDRAACMAVMKSNTPEFFAMDELALFEKWLVAQEKGFTLLLKKSTISY